MITTIVRAQTRTQSMAGVLWFAEKMEKLKMVATCSQIIPWFHKLRLTGPPGPLLRLPSAAFPVVVWVSALHRRSVDHHRLFRWGCYSMLLSLLLYAILIFLDSEYSCSKSGKLDPLQGKSGSSLRPWPFGETPRVWSPDPRAKCQRCHRVNSPRNCTALQWDRAAWPPWWGCPLIADVIWCDKIYIELLRL